MNYRFSLNYLWLLFVVASCATQKNTVYVNDMEEEMQYYVTQKQELKIQKDDRILITVDAKIPELALPFKTPGAAVQISTEGEVKTSNQNNSLNKGYKVDANGNIDFPVLGTLHIEGLTLIQLKKLIADKIIEGHYINEPLVVTEFANIKILVFGEIGTKGIINAEGDRLTLLEAIVKSGGLTDKARLDGVNVIREVNNRKQVFKNDIRSKKIFESPAYYLQQNDIVYVEPEPVSRKTFLESAGFRYGTVILSIIVTVATIAQLLKK